MLAVQIPFCLNNDTTETSLDPLIAVITECTAAAQEVSSVQCEWGRRGWESTCQSCPSYSSPGGASQSWRNWSLSGRRPCQLAVELSKKEAYEMESSHTERVLLGQKG